MGTMGLLLASYGGLEGILSGLTKSTDHPRRVFGFSELLGVAGRMLQSTRKGIIALFNRMVEFNVDPMVP